MGDLHEVFDLQENQKNFSIICTRVISQNNKKNFFKQFFGLNYGENTPKESNIIRNFIIIFLVLTLSRKKNHPILILDYSSTSKKQETQVKFKKIMIGILKDI